MTHSCDLATTTLQARFELFATTILVDRKRWRPKLEGKFKHIHTWTIGAKNFGRHNETSMQALWTERIVATHQIFSNKPRKVMNKKTLMLHCCFNLETKGKIYKWEQQGLGTCTKLTLTSSQMILWFHPHPIQYCFTIYLPMSYLPTYLPSIYYVLPTYLPTYLFIHHLFIMSYLPTYLPMSHLPTYLFTYHLPIYVLPTYLLPIYLPCTYLCPTYLPTYLLTYHLPTYVPLIYLPSTYLCPTYLPTYLCSIYLPMSHLPTYLYFIYLSTYIWRQFYELPIVYINRYEHLKT
jgi:hypothetical protein